MSAPAAVSASSTARCVDVPNGPSIPFTWDTSGQHTLTWTQPIRMRIRGTTSTLGAGSCNLYTYPSVRLLRGTTVRPDVLEGPRLEVLAALLTAIATDKGGILTGGWPFDLADASGATPILALFVANTPRAVELCLALYAARPELLAHCLADAGRPHQMHLM